MKRLDMVDIDMEFEGSRAMYKSSISLPQTKKIKNSAIWGASQAAQHRLHTLLRCTLLGKL
jgi:hypothetical protein